MRSASGPPNENGWRGTGYRRDKRYLFVFVCFEKTNNRAVAGVSLSQYLAWVRHVGSVSRVQEQDLKGHLWWHEKKQIRLLTRSCLICFPRCAENNNAWEEVDETNTRGGGTRQEIAIVHLLHQREASAGFNVLSRVLPGRQEHGCNHVRCVGVESPERAGHSASDKVLLDICFNHGLVYETQNHIQRDTEPNATIVGREKKTNGEQVSSGVVS